MAQIQLSNVSKTFGVATEALQQVSLEMEPGSFVVILGPSGAGKSTLLRVINGLETPTRGDVAFDGLRVVPANFRRIRSQIGMVFQQFGLVGRLNVMSNVLTGRLAHQPFLGRLLNCVYLFPKRDYEIAHEVIARVGLTEKTWERTDQLSGGQQQRVGVARALAQRPKVILADEPVASLDPRTGEQIMALLRQICDEEKITVIVNLHQVHLAERFADRIIGLKSGRVMFDESVAELDEEAIRHIYGGSLPDDEAGSDE